MFGSPPDGPTWRLLHAISKRACITWVLQRFVCHIHLLYRVAHNLCFFVDLSYKLVFVLLIVKVDTEGSYYYCIAIFMFLQCCQRWFYSHTSKSNVLISEKLYKQGWRDGSVVENTGCSYRIPEFSSQHPHSIL